MQNRQLQSATAGITLKEPPHGSVVIRIGATSQDIHTQYHQSRPWLLLDDSQTYTSSAMPLKLNPGVVMTARAKASDVVASTQLMLLPAHNITPGMTDYKASFEPAKTTGCHGA